MSHAQQLTIGQKIFETRKAADRFVRDLLYGQPLKIAIPDPHHSFLSALISMHVRAEEKIGKGINHFSVENSRTPCVGGDVSALLALMGLQQTSLSMNA
jgi:uncharacterized protein DUF3223